ncbi:Ubiquitin-specific protease family C19-related protein [Trema orientale]|uniref:Ubiquitin-specific protease family C19-related protein n=1 Tax=Trema orientale TaxID=63057 RepID=A0A2P5F0K5_TREOI|nr:Ubiquitin-specific protease family C19-related protein [Trema orientale]
MGSRVPSHQLSSGLYVSGRPEQLKERQPTIGSRSIPYTGGDVKKSGELGKMFDIPVVDPSSNGPPSSKTSRPSSSSQHNSGSVRSGPNSGPVSKHSNSGPIPKKASGPMVPLQPTGLITSAPVFSGPQGSSGGLGRRSGHMEHTGSTGKAVYGSAVTNLSEEAKVSFRVSKAVWWVLLVVVVMGLLVGAFLMAAAKKALVLVSVAGAVVLILVFVMWNYFWKERILLGYVNKYPDAELRGAIDGQFVKVTGVVTCGSIPLESSYQKEPRCVYVSTELYEYKGWGGKSANPRHRCFSWGSRYSEKYVADFYVSDFQSGLRALVKVGHGAKVAPFVKPSTVVDITKENRELSPCFLRWLADRNLSYDDRIMRLKEGYIKEGSTVSVMGVVRRQDNVLMIVPSAEPDSTGCQWLRCLLPTYVEGLILTSDDNQDAEVIPV